MKSIKLHRPARLSQLAAAAGLAGAGLLIGGCNDAQKGGLIGAGAGAGLGAIIGHQSGHGGEGALIGAGAGALGGYIIGNESDKAKHNRYDHYDY
jgi:hypothetical protein